MTDRIPLQELEAYFLKVTSPGHYQQVDRIEEAQGVLFLCPKCFRRNGGARGTHSVLCWSRSRGTPEEEHPLPGRWRLEGTGIADLHLEGDQPGGGGARSVQLTGGGCGWHGFINHGFAEGDL